jgi:hypothetical protein
MHWRRLADQQRAPGAKAAPGLGATLSPLLLTAEVFRELWPG